MPSEHGGREFPTRDLCGSIALCPQTAKPLL